MQPDFQELTFRAVIANATHPFVVQEFHTPVSARIVNACWISSLLTSLSAALIAIMGKDWIASYRMLPMDNLRQWAELRQLRSDSIERWYLREVIRSAPLLLHLSLLLFTLGVVIFFAPIDSVVTAVSGGLAAAIATFYVVTVASPTIWTSSPYRSSSSYAIRRATRTVHACFKTFLVGLAELPRTEKLRPAVDLWTDIDPKPSPTRTASCLSWLYSTTATSETLSLVMTGLADVDHGASVASHISSHLERRITEAIIADLTVEPSSTLRLTRDLIVGSRINIASDTLTALFTRIFRPGVEGARADLQAYGDTLATGACRLYGVLTDIPESLWTPFFCNVLPRDATVQRLTAEIGRTTTMDSGVDSHLKRLRAELFMLKEWVMHYEDDPRPMARLLHDTMPPLLRDNELHGITRTTAQGKVHLFTPVSRRALTRNRQGYIAPSSKF